MKNKIIFLIISAIALTFSIHTFCVEAIHTNCTTTVSIPKSLLTLNEVLTKRYSGNSYDPSRSVARNRILAICEAGHLAPSAYNEQPWRFIICNKISCPQAYQKAFNALGEYNQGWSKNAPVLIIAIAATQSSYNHKFNRWATFDTGAATFSMVLKATSLGLMAHQMGGFDEAKLREAFSIPANFIPLSIMAIGYPAADSTQLPKKRNPLGDHFYFESWGRSFE